MSIESVEIKIIGKMIWVKNNNQWVVSELSLTPNNNDYKNLKSEKIDSKKEEK